jgi:hypothetical protein
MLRCRVKTFPRLGTFCMPRVVEERVFGITSGFPDGKTLGVFRARSKRCDNDTIGFGTVRR